MYSATDQLNGFNLTVKQQTSNPITYLFTYLSNNLVKTITAAGKQFSLYFDEGGQFISRTNPNNTGDEFKYNDAGQVIESKTNSITQSNNGSQGWQQSDNSDLHLRFPGTETDQNNRRQHDHLPLWERQRLVRDQERRR